MIKIPQQVLTELNNLCQKNSGIKINIYHEKDNSYYGGLEFDGTGTAKLKEMTITLEGYLSRLLTFSRIPIKVYINDISLEQIEVKYIQHEK